MRRGNVILVLSVVSSVMMVALAFFQWHLVHIVTLFLMPFLWLMAAGFFLVMAMEKPRTGDFGGDFIEIEQFDEHWYFVSSG